MYAKQKTEAIPCTPGAFPGGLTRTRFYDGMLLTQSHLVREQNYWRMKRKLTNRALGSGVVWGLRLKWDSGKRTFLLSPGYALDCCGNDLVVECPQEILERTLVDKHDPKTRAFLSHNKTSGTLRCPDPDPDLPLEACLILKYIECAGDPQPIYEDDCTSNVTHCEYSSVRESVQVCLAPPPPEPEPTPIDNFCAQLAQLHQICAENPDCTLFEMENVLAAEEFPVLVEVHNLTTNKSVMVRPQVGRESVLASEPVTAPEADHKILISVKPAPGYVILQGQLQADPLVELTPFGGELLTTGEAILVAGGQSAFTIEDLRVASLLTNSNHVQAILGLGISTDALGSAFVNVESLEYTVLGIGPTCNNKLAPALIFANDPLCTLKTLALTVLCGWFKGLLDTDAQQSITGKHVAAWYVCALAWRLLFDAKLDDNKGSALNDALKNLMAEWCVAFIYPGPHCATDHHGVYLGCVQLSDKGSILSFEPQKHRRYVITGPLLTHWGSQFGLAPVDVVIGRIASWICCLSSTSMPAIPAGRLAALIDGLPLDEYGMAIVAGDEATLRQYMTNHNLSLHGSVGSISLEQAAKSALQILSRNERDGADSLTRNRRVYALGDTNLYLLEPVQDNFISRDHGGVEFPRAVERRTDSLRPLARTLVRDFVTGVAESIELSGLKVLDNDETMTALVRELKTNNVTTLAHYLDIGPERAARIAWVNLHENDEVDTERDVFVAAEDLTLASEKVLDSIITPFVAIDSAGNTVSGEDLVKKENIKAISDNLNAEVKRGTVPQNELKRIGKRVAGREWPDARLSG